MAFDLTQIGGQTDPASVAANRKAERKAQTSAEVEKIREMGFSAYVDEIKDRKVEELREKLLQRMGLNEESLAQMSPDQRKAVEDAIAQEIQRQQAANSLVNGSQKDSNAPKDQLSLIASVTGRGDAFVDPKMLDALQGVSDKDEAEERV